MIGVLIVDDQALFRTLLAITLGRHPDIQVLGHCTDGTEVVETARRLQPDVILMDLHMPGTGGLQATRDLLRTQPAARVIIFSASPAPHDISQAADAGASGYLIKGGDLHDVAHAIQVVASGGTTWPARSRPHLVQPSHPDGGPDLTPADLQPHTDHPLPTR